MDTQPILIGYDGSEGSANAISEVARLFPGARAVIVHVGHMPTFYIGGYGGGPPITADVSQEIEKAAQDQANKTAAGGTEIARKSGLEAEGFAYITPTSVWRRLLDAADDVHASAVVVGSRGLGGIRSVVLGSTSQALAHHSSLPLLIVPPRREQ